MIDDNNSNKDPSFSGPGITFLDMYPNTPFAEGAAKAIREAGFSGEGTARFSHQGANYVLTIAQDLQNMPPTA
jgi:hypothetical protein